MSNSSSKIFLRCSSGSPLICFSPDWCCSSDDSIFKFAISSSCRSPFSCGSETSALFLVGAFSFKEKSPTITVASFFSFFFRQTTELIAYVPLFTESDKTTQAKSDQWKFSAKGPPFFFYLFYVTYKTGRDQRVPPFNFFSALCEIFFENFLRSQKSPPSSFLIFCNRMFVNEPKRVPFSFFGTMQHFRSFFQKKIFEKKIQTLFPVGKQ